MGRSCVPRVVVKFHDADVLERWTVDEIAPLRQDVEDPEELQAILEEIRATVDTLGAVEESDARRNGLRELAGLTRFDFDFDAYAPERLLAGIPRETLDRLLGQAREQDSPYVPRDLTRYLTLKSPDGLTEEEALDVAAELRTWPLVETAYVDQCESEPPASSSTLANLNAVVLERPYLDGPESGGINARGAGSIAGGGGEGITLVDIEGGWNIAPVHEGLPADLIVPEAADHVDTADLTHGNQVLSVLLGLRPPPARAEGAGAEAAGGLAKDARVKLVSKYQPHIDTPHVRPEEPDIPSAIVRAIDASQHGDILLLEVQWRWSQRLSPSGSNVFRKLPVEAEPATLEVIRLATALGRVVVEAAGNGSHNLDEVRVLIEAQVGQPVLTSARDSGAILVGALASSRPLVPEATRHPDSNWGCRVDCWAPGTFVFAADAVVAGDRNDTYRDDFARTSAAAAIVAGAVAALQGIARRHGGPLAPSQVRDFLRDPAINTRLDLALDLDHCSPAERETVRPNLGEIIASSGWG